MTAMEYRPKDTNAQSGSCDEMDRNNVRQRSWQDDCADKLQSACSMGRCYQLDGLELCLPKPTLHNAHLNMGSRLGEHTSDLSNTRVCKGRRIKKMLVLRYCLKPYPDRKETGHDRACRRVDDETISDRNGDNTNPAGTHALECRLEGSHMGDGIVDGFDVPNVSSLLMVAQKSCALPEEVKNDGIFEEESALIRQSEQRA